MFSSSSLPRSHLPLNLPLRPSSTIAINSPVYGPAGESESESGNESVKFPLSAPAASAARRDLFGGVFGFWLFWLLWPGCKHSLLSKQLSISGGANIFSHFAFFPSKRLTWPALLLTSNPFFCQMLMVVVALLPRPPTSTRPLWLQLQQLYWIWPDIGKVSSQATR